MQLLFLTNSKMCHCVKAEQCMCNCNKYNINTMHVSHLFFKSCISFLFSQEFLRHESCRNFRCIKSLSFSNVKYKILQLVRSQNNAENSQTSSAVIFFSFVPRWRRIQNKYKRLAKYSWVCVWACILHQMHICTLTQVHVWRGALSRHGHLVLVQLIGR